MYKLILFLGIISIFPIIGFIFILIGKIIKKYNHMKWLKNEEPLHRYAKGYPDDWGFRREEIIKNAKYICHSCGRTIIGSPHIHHIIPLSKGGDHSLSNLRLLCENCHCTEHPNLRKVIEKNYIFKSLNLTDKVKVVRSSTKEWKCAICNKIIEKGSSYYGDYWTKICSECAPRKIKKRMC